MAFVPIPQAMRGVLNMSQHGQQRVTALGFKKLVGNPTATDLTNVAQALFTWWSNFYRQYMVDDVKLNSIIVTDVSVANGGQATLFPATNQNGVLTAEPEPGNVTATMSWRSDRIGRANRGRTYYPGMDTLQSNDDDTLSNATITAFASVASNLIFGVPSGIVFAVLSKRQALAIPILTYVIDNVLDSQRRRLPSRGR